MSDLFDEKFEEQQEQSGEAPEFPDELVGPLQQFTVVGHLTDTFTYGGQEFSIQTMTIGEELEALRAAQKYDDITVASGRIYATAMVAGAIKSLNGNPLVMPVSDKQDIATLKFRKVLDWFWPTIEIAYQHFAQLEIKQKEVLDGLEKTLDEDTDTEEPTDSLE